MIRSETNVSSSMCQFGVGSQKVYKIKNLIKMFARKIRNVVPIRAKIICAATFPEIVDDAIYQLWLLK